MRKPQAMTTVRSLKFTLPERDADRLLRKKKVAGARVRKHRVRSSRQTYYDTPGLSFYKSGVGLCIESGDDAKQQTIRQLSRAPEWLREAQTRTSPLEPERPALALESGKSSPTAFREVFSVSRAHHELRFKPKKSGLSLVLERGKIEADAQNGENLAEEICEAELRHKGEDGSALFKAALKLQETTELRLQPRSAVSRGFALIGQKAELKHVKAEKIALEPGMSVSDALQASCHNIMEHLLQNEGAALSGNPNGIHQTRVAMRRFRAALRAFKKALPYEGRKAYNGELRWFQQCTGPARDWHVFQDETLKRLDPSDYPGDELELLGTLAKERRREHSLDAATTLTSRRYTRLLLRLGHWLSELAEDDAPRLEQPVEPFARKAINKAHRDLVAGIEDVRDGVLEDMHKVRIKAKKARYAVEFFQSLFEPGKVQAYLRLVKDMQENLGEANDARVARSLMAEIEPERLSPETFETFHTWAGERIEECLRAAQPGLEALAAQPMVLLDNEAPAQDG